MEVACACYRHAAVCIHRCGTADYRPGDCSCAGAARGLQRKAASFVDGAGCAGDEKSRLRCLAHSKYIGLGCFSAVADRDCLAIMFCDRQHCSLSRGGGQLAAGPCEGFICVVVVVHLYRQTAQIQCLPAGVGQVGGLGSNLDSAHSFFGGGDRYSLADGFRIVAAGLRLCKEVVGRIGGQTRKLTPCLPVVRSFIQGVVSVSNRCASIAGFYHSLIQSNLRGAVRLPGKRNLIRGRGNGKGSGCCSSIIACSGGGHCDRTSVDKIPSATVAVFIVEGVICAIGQRCPVPCHADIGGDGGAGINILAVHRHSSIFQIALYCKLGAAGFRLQEHIFSAIHGINGICIEIPRVACNLHIVQCRCVALDRNRSFIQLLSARLRVAQVKVHCVRLCRERIDLLLNRRLDGNGRTIAYSISAYSFAFKAHRYHRLFQEGIVNRPRNRSASCERSAPGQSPCSGDRAVVCQGHAAVDGDGFSSLDFQGLAAGDLCVGGEGEGIAIDSAVVPFKDHAAPARFLILTVVTDGRRDN